MRLPDRLRSIHRLGALLAAGVVALSGCTVLARSGGASPQTAPAAHVAPAAALNIPPQAVENTVNGTGTADLAAFSGQWRSHSFLLDVAPDGAAVAQWRTYRWCDATPATPQPAQHESPACDTMQDNRVIPGGRARLALAVDRAGWAAGQVLDSTDPAMLAPGPVRLQLVNDRLRLVQGPESLPKVVTELCGARTAHAAACGA